MGASTIIYFGQVAYLLTLLSYSVRNITWLRVLAIGSSILTIYYGFQATNEPLWIPIAWNCLFLIVNLIQLSLTRWRSRKVALSPLENFLSQTALSNFPSAEVKSFALLAEEGALEAGAILIKDNSDLHELYCILHGSVGIYSKGEQIATLTAGHFVGEMSLLTQSKTRSDVVSLNEVKLLIWAHDAIESWVNSDTTRLVLLQTAMGKQVVEQLLRQQTDKTDPDVERIAG